ncbi:hypothetical protein GCM10010924_48690 [Rhizobium wenxiniae]|uniref:Uncharacterized protein n=1 Tax=Rhizobium wenxiniae TaxID=1737357 RepID=A0A7W9YC83_9HYPH|nr:hypothetical protein [Rhizobium wenxiniae]MBB6165233.1 hypothetical protein [Rhizobium wenxiniae]GGG13813.1 hypothetical protein GCM10010924_48690 [Rhizobium wenxiniae]
MRTEGQSEAEEARREPNLAREEPQGGEIWAHGGIAHNRVAVRTDIKATALKGKAPEQSGTSAIHRHTDTAAFRIIMMSQFQHFKRISPHIASKSHQIGFAYSLSPAAVGCIA